MAPRVIKLREPTAAAQEQAAAQEPQAEPEPHSQRKRPEVGRFWLQVDRQTKRSFATLEAAETAGMVVKKGHPIVQVAVYDSLESSHKLIELPGA